MAPSAIAERTRTTRELGSDCTDVLKRIITWTQSQNLYYLVKGHVEATIGALDDVRVVDVQLVMCDGRQRRGYTTNNVRSVIVKLSNEGVIAVGVEVMYVTSEVIHLAGHKKAKEKDDEPWYVYVVRCADASLYCGVSKNVENRVKEHNGNCRGAKYTRSRRPVTLVKQWRAKDKSDAFKAEKRFKQLTKARKEEICSS